MHRVAVLGLEGVIPFDLGIPFQVFGDARDADERPLYDVSFAARRRGLVRTSAGFSIAAPFGLSRLDWAQTVVVVGSDPPQAGVDRQVRAALRSAQRRGARLASICTGAFVLAECGLLDDRRATTHWRYCDDFHERYPQVKLDPAVLFIEEGELLTSAGAAAGIDLCLHVVSVDYGLEVANRVARRTVSAPHRSGGQAQFIETPMPSPRLQSLESTRGWALEHLHEPISLDDLARRAAVSVRTLVRHFRSETGTTPLQWLTEQRLLLARRLLEQTDLPVEVVARRSGFGSGQTLRLRFRQALGTTPRDYREAFGAARAGGTIDRGGARCDALAG
jgi:transcriptional regulator GlxA family with amidase domain